MAARSRRRDSEGHVDPFAKRRQRYRAVLSSLKLWDLFAQIPRAWQDGILCLKIYDPVLEFDETFPTDAEHLLLRKSVEAGFCAASLIIDDAEVTIKDFFGVLLGLNLVLQGTTPHEKAKLPAPCVRFIDHAAPILAFWIEEHAKDAWDALHTATIVPLIAHSRLDMRLLSSNCVSEMIGNNKLRVRIQVGVEPPCMKQITLDGERRNMYRVGTINCWTGVRWSSWKSSPDETGNGKPIFIQSHALRQLRQRANLPAMLPYIEYWLASSLQEPEIVDRQGSDLLVAFRLSEQRIGYLVVTPLDDVIAIRTFKFLTMENTPEARRLHKFLRLTRRDVDWLGLHDLKTFTESDLKDDPVLRPILENCGCGHLFELAEADYTPVTRPLAAEMKRYLRIAA